MKLSISNIAWEPDELESHLDLLQQCQCSAVELAPTLLWKDPQNIQKNQSDILIKILGKYGISVVGFHALFYQLDHLQLFKSKQSRQDMMKYSIGLAKLCHQLNGQFLVWGSPNNRKLFSHTKSEAFEIASDFFYELSRHLSNCNVTVCLEPLPDKEAQFLNNSQEAIELVQRINSPYIQLMLDIKAMHEQKEDSTKAIQQSFPHLKHIHIGDPGLAPPGYTNEVDHEKAAKALQENGYNNYLSIEMKRGFLPSKQQVRNSLNFVKKYYLGAATHV